MNKLIKNELIKIFHKKGVYVIGIIILLFCLLNNILLKNEYNDDGSIKNSYVYDSSFEKESIENELSYLDVNNKDDISTYIELKTRYDIILLNDKYGYDSWQNYIINNNLYDIINNINYYTYSDKESSELKKYQDQYNLYISRFDSDNWKIFVTEEIDGINKEIDDHNNLLKKTTDKQDISNYNSIIDNLNKKLVVLNYRLDHDISYKNSYLNDAIVGYSDYLNVIQEYESVSEHSYEEKQDYYNSLSRLNINKYIIESGNNINKTNDLRCGIKDIINDYQLFIIIIILIIAGSIVSEEYNKGTIKLLLVKPYSRSKILLSKYLTSIIMVLITIGFTFVIEFVIGSIFFGFDSLSVPVVVYNFNNMALEYYNVFLYSLIMIASKLPMIILILTLAFALSTITGNSVIAITLTILGYLFGDLINQIAVMFNLNWMRYFVTPNWNFTEYLFGGLPMFENVNLLFSIIICIIYMIVMLVVTFIIFKKKNIKNI